MVRGADLEGYSQDTIHRLIRNMSQCWQYSYKYMGAIKLLSMILNWCNELWAKWTNLAATYFFTFIFVVSSKSALCRLIIFYFYQMMCPLTVNTLPSAYQYRYPE